MQKIQELIVVSLAAQKDRLLLWLVFFQAVGIALYFSLKTEPHGGIALTVLVFSILAIPFLWRKREEGPAFYGLFCLLIFIAMTGVGFASAKLQTALSYTPMLEKKMQPVLVTGTIETLEPTESGSRIVLKELEIERLEAAETPRKIRLSVRKDEGLRAGQRIKVLAGLNPPSPPVSPNAFDFQFQSYFDGLGAVGFAYKAPEIVEQREEAALDRLRQSITQRILAKADPAASPVIAALMTGQRKAITEDDWQAMRESGLAHMLAISGLHVGMVAVAVFFALRLCLAAFPYLALHYPIKKWAAFAALLAALFYTLIVGATIPTQRALIMTGLVMVAIMLDRSPFSLRLVALAAFLVLLFSPDALLSVSFQMSFAAVAALICFYDWIRPLWKKMHSRAGFMRRVAVYFLGVTLTTVIAGSATGLFSLYHFGQYASYGVLSNFIAVPILGVVVMPLLVLTYVLMPLGLEGLVFPVLEQGIIWIVAIAHWVANMDGAVWRVASWSSILFTGMVLCFWFILVWRGRIMALIVWLVLASFSVLAYSSPQPDILIGEKAELIAIRSEDGRALWFSNGRSQRYTAERWLQQSGLDAEEKKKLWPKEGRADGFPLLCDPQGCRGEMKNYKIAIVKKPSAMNEDCAWADLLISEHPIPRSCRAGHAIDLFDLMREGNQAIWLSDEKIEIKTVKAQRGTRPWTQ